MTLFAFSADRPNSNAIICQGPNYTVTSAAYHIILNQYHQKSSIIQSTMNTSPTGKSPSYHNPIHLHPLPSSKSANVDTQCPGYLYSDQVSEAAHGLALNTICTLRGEARLGGGREEGYKFTVKVLLLLWPDQHTQSMIRWRPVWIIKEFRITIKALNFKHFESKVLLLELKECDPISFLQIYLPPVPGPGALPPVRLT